MTLSRIENLTYEERVTIFPGHTMKAYRGSKGTAPYILNIGIGRSDQFHGPAALTPLPVEKTPALIY
jgi:hypothetical protein